MKRTALVSALAGAAFLAASGAALAAGGTTITVKADPVGLKYDKSAITAKAGKVTLVMPNPSMLQHNVAIKGTGVKTVLGNVVGKGGTSRVSATLKPGVYTFFCSVAGHEAGGMKGTLTVR